MEKSNIDEKIKLLTGNGMWHTQEVEGFPPSICPTGRTACASRRKRSVRTTSVWCPPAIPRPAP